MAKGSRAAGRTVMRTVGGKGKRPEVPVNTAESNAAGDKQARMLHFALLGLTVILSIALFVYGVYLLTQGVTAHPVNWASTITGIACASATFLIGRTMLWLSYIGPIMLAANKKAWESQEQLSRQALRFSKFFPAGGNTAALILVQSLVSRGQYDEALEIGEAEYKKYGADPKQAENLGPLYAALGMAQQMRGEARQSIVWNDRAIESFTTALDNFKNPKGFMSKLAASQAPQVTGNIRTQLTVAYFNNATSQFNLQNHRQAKVNFQKAMEFAKESPDFPEKQSLVSVAREQLQRLKHV